MPRLPPKPLKATIHMQMANHKRVKCLGIAQDVRVRVLGIDCMVDFYVMRAKENTYPVILGLPWLIATTGANQNWETVLLFQIKLEGRR